MFNKTLMELAKYTLNKQASEKTAFQPAGAMGGGPGSEPMPQDPSMGGMPPDQAQAAMPQPSTGPDQTAAMTAGGGGADPNMIRQMVQQEMAAGGHAPGAGGKGVDKKQTEQALANDIYHVKSMLSYLFHLWDIPLPQHILDGPNRDPQTGAVLPTGTPGSTSDPNYQMQQAAQSKQQPSAIKPIEPIGAAVPQDMGQKAGSFQLEDTKAFSKISERASALMKIIESANN